MTQFIRRLIGAVTLNASVYEEIEADPSASLQAALVVVLVCAAGGFVAMSWNRFDLMAFVIGAVATVAAWMIWVGMVRSIGTSFLREATTRSNTPELLRTLGFASAPGISLAFAAIRPAAPMVFVLTGLWMVATTIVGTRQALDYRSTARAMVVCVAAWLLSFGVLAIVGMGTSQTVQ